MADTPSTVAITGPSGPISILAETDGSSNFALQSIPRVNAAPLSTTNPMPVSDAAAPGILIQETASALALGTPSDIAWIGTGSSSVIAVLKAIWGKVSGSTRTPYIGPVATRTMMNTSIYSGSPFSTMSRTYHYARENITTLQIGYASWMAYGSVGSVTEGVPPAGACTMTGSIEYPAGTFHQLTWSGATTANVAPGVTLLSDPVAIAIPFGAKFYLRRFITSGSFAFIDASLTNPTAGVFVDVANGDATNFTATDLTMSGTVTDAGSHTFAPPCIILGTTARPTIAIIGESIAVGMNDTPVASVGDLGYLGRSVAKLYGYANLAAAGDTTGQFIAGTNSSLRRALASHCTHTVCNLGINDITSGVPLATIQANLATLVSLSGLSAKPFYQDTILPATTSSDGWTTLANQTPFATESVRVALNTWLRTIPATVTGICDSCSAVESALNSGLWVVPGYTPDGVHMTALGYETIAERGTVNAFLIAPA